MHLPSHGVFSCQQQRPLLFEERRTLGGCVFGQRCHVVCGVYGLAAVSLTGTSGTNYTYFPSATTYYQFVSTQTYYVGRGGVGTTAPTLDNYLNITGLAPGTSSPGTSSPGISSPITSSPGTLVVARNYLNSYVVRRNLVNWRVVGRRNIS
eukprot:TRINITY_DN6392_c0_g1_i1.p2 TRINITY_DN6392_c0_g1~~TRINITY_DN6392_c0_g1_i1.p2  ORF type:complete len:151 (-),score=19.85 TRINITY_DN6392_c0_g1_i1:418-870(-)